MVRVPDELDSYIRAYCELGFSLVWLKKGQKSPFERDWTRKETKTYDELASTYKTGFNIGVRLGKWSRNDNENLYLYGIDVDIRDENKKYEAKEALKTAFPGINFEDMWAVKSGSGGPSVHFYFYAEGIFETSRIAHSTDKVLDADGKPHWAWEIDFESTGRQLVLPPSIHPVTKKPYRWLRGPDLDEVELGLVDLPVVPDEILDNLASRGLPPGATIEARPPLDLLPGQLEQELSELPLMRLEDYSSVISIGEALHHQTRGSEYGYRLWLEARKRSPKWVGERKERDWRVKWKGFGRNEGRRKIVTWATMREWFKAAVAERLLSEMDEDEDTNYGSIDSAPAGKNAPEPVKRAPVEDDLLAMDGDDEASDVDVNDLFEMNETRKVDRRPKNIAACFKRDRTMVEALTDMNMRYAAVLLSGKFRIASFRKDNVFTAITKDDLFLYEADNKIDVEEADEDKGTKIVSYHIPKTWIGSGVRRTYSGIDFDPNMPPSQWDDAPFGELNLWRGFAMKPAKTEDCPTILAFLKEVISNDDEVFYEYLIRWLAHIFQKPGEKPGVAVVLRGEKGVGKGSLFRLLKRIVGVAHTAFLDKPGALTGRFNAFLEVAMLVCVDEAFWAADKAAEGTLKSMITEPTVPIERKGVDPIMLKNFSRFIFATNNDWAIPATENERRYAASYVSDRYLGNREYYRALSAAIDGDEARAFLTYLMNMDLFGFDVRVAPVTEELLNQKQETLSITPAGCWYDILKDGVLPASGSMDDESGQWSDGPVEVSRNALRERFNEIMAEKSRYPRPIDSAVIGKVLKKYVPSAYTKIHRANGSLGRFYVIPPLDECRGQYEKIMRTSSRVWDD